VDSIQIEQVLLNLIRNAIEAMIEKKNPVRRLSIESRINEQGNVEITVADTGHGIESEMIDELFEPFYTSKSSGMGMGLSICRSIIEAHDGRLWAESRKSKGTRFHIAIPLSAGAGAGF
jgi:two-component system sensor kinase FixL